MKKNNRAFITKLALFLLMGVTITVGFTGCRSEIIPEISPKLFHRDQLDVAGKNIIGRIVKNDNEVVLMTGEGQMLRWNPGDNMVNFLYRLPMEIQPLGLRTKSPGYIDSLDYAGSRDFIVLRKKTEEKDTGTFVIFDLKLMKETAILENRKIKQVVAVNQTFLIYVDAGDNIQIMNIHDQSLAVSFPVNKNAKGVADKVYNCVFDVNKVIILTTGNVYMYYPRTGSSDKITLVKKANSPFYFERGRLYYGSTDRYLVSFSIFSKKLRWKFRLADNLSSMPRKIGRYITVIPEDNNIYFFNRHGSLYWWEKLDSTLLMDPLPLEENAAVFLWDNSVKFFNFKEKIVITHRFQPHRHAYSNAVQIGEYLYVITANKEEERDIKDERLVKIGNHYGVKIISDPKDIMSVGKSIAFELEESNLIEPEYNVTITRLGKDSENEQPRVVFRKRLTKYDDPLFAWIPKEPTRYRVDVEIDAKNKKGLKMSKIFETVDVEKKLQEFYYRVQTQCGQAGE